MVFQVLSVRSRVDELPITNRELLARVRATFIRRKSRKKPMLRRLTPERTQDRMMISFSWPWKPSTVLKLQVRLRNVSLNSLNSLGDLLAVGVGKLAL